MSQDSNQSFSCPNVPCGFPQLTTLHQEHVVLKKTRHHNLFADCRSRLILPTKWASPTFEGSTERYGIHKALGKKLPYTVFLCRMFWWNFKGINIIGNVWCQRKLYKNSKDEKKYANTSSFLFKNTFQLFDKEMQFPCRKHDICEVHNP